MSKSGKWSVIKRKCQFCGHEQNMYERTTLWVCEECEAVNGDLRVIDLAAKNEVASLADELVD